jgi:Leucine-rich repeat (LRR) protein
MKMRFYHYWVCLGVCWLATASACVAEEKTDELTEKDFQAGVRVRFAQRQTRQVPICVDFTDSALPVKDENLIILRRTPELERLDLSWTRITDEGLSNLRFTSRLQILYLDSTAISDRGLEVLVKQNLRHLTLLSLKSTRVSAKGFAHLSKLPSLRCLKLSSINLKIADFKELARLTSVDCLDVLDTGLTDEGLDEFTKHPGYRKINLGFNARLTSEKVALLFRPAILEEAYLAGLDITDAEMRQLTSCRKLQKLCLANVKDTPKIFSRLKGLQSLKELDLSDTEVQDVDIEFLTQLPQLERLLLLRTKVSDKSFAVLRRLARLRELGISSDTKIPQVTEKALEEFQKQRPEVKIVW